MRTIYHECSRQHEIDLALAISRWSYPALLYNDSSFNYMHPFFPPFSRIRSSFKMDNRGKLGRCLLIHSPFFPLLNYLFFSKWLVCHYLLFIPGHYTISPPQWEYIFSAPTWLQPTALIWSCNFVLFFFFRFSTSRSFLNQMITSSNQQLICEKKVAVTSRQAMAMEELYHFTEYIYVYTSMQRSIQLAPRFITEASKDFWCLQGNAFCVWLFWYFKCSSGLPCHSSLALVQDVSKKATVN